MSNILSDFNTSLQKLKTFNKNIVSNRQNIDKFQNEVSEGLNEINEKVNILKGLIKKLQDEIQHSKQNISSNTSLITQKDANVDNNTRIITRLRQEIAMLKQQKEELTRELENKPVPYYPPDNSLEELQKCRNSFRDMMAANKTEKTQLNAQIDAIQKSKNDEELAKTKALDLIKQHQQRLKLNKEENDSLKTQIQTLTAELNALKKGKTEDAAEFDKQRLDQQKQHEELLTKQLEASRKELQSLTDRNSTIELQIKTLTQENTRLTKENTDLKQENTDLNTKIIEATKIINAATQNIDKLNKIDMQSAGPRIAEINKTLTEMIQSFDSTYMPPPRSSFSPPPSNQFSSSSAAVADDNDEGYFYNNPPNQISSSGNMSSSEQMKHLYNPNSSDENYNRLTGTEFNYDNLPNQYGVVGNRKQSRINLDQVNPNAGNLNFKQKEKSLVTPDVVGDNNGFSFDDANMNDIDIENFEGNPNMKSSSSSLSMPLSSTSLPKSNNLSIEHFGKPSSLNTRRFKTNPVNEKFSTRAQYPSSTSVEDTIHPDILKQIKEDIITSNDKENGMTKIYNKYSTPGQKTQIENYINTIKRLNKPPDFDNVKRDDYEIRDGGKNRTKKVKKVKKVKKTKTQKGGFIYNTNTKRRNLHSNSNSSRSNSSSRSNKSNKSQRSRHKRIRHRSSD
jgi:hypothetical protein